MEGGFSSIVNSRVVSEHGDMRAGEIDPSFGQTLQSNFTLSECPKGGWKFQSENIIFKIICKGDRGWGKEYKGEFYPITEGEFAEIPSSILLGKTHYLKGLQTDFYSLPDLDNCIPIEAYDGICEGKITPEVQTHIVEIPEIVPEELKKPREKKLFVLSWR